MKVVFYWKTWTILGIYMVQKVMTQKEKYGLIRSNVGIVMKVEKSLKWHWRM
jgi:hypothetical protein